MVKCEYCGQTAESSENAFCTGCGRRLPGPNQAGPSRAEEKAFHPRAGESTRALKQGTSGQHNCTKCGSPLPSGRAVCPNCSWRQRLLNFRPRIWHLAVLASGFLGVAIVQRALPWIPAHSSLSSHGQPVSRFLYAQLPEGFRLDEDATALGFLNGTLFSSGCYIARNAGQTCLMRLERRLYCTEGLVSWSASPSGRDWIVLDKNSARITTASSRFQLDACAPDSVSFTYDGRARFVCRSGQDWFLFADGRRIRLPADLAIGDGGLPVCAYLPRSTACIARERIFVYSSRGDRIATQTLLFQPEWIYPGSSETNVLLAARNSRVFRVSPDEFQEFPVVPDLPPYLWNGMLVACTGDLCRLIPSNSQKGTGEARPWGSHASILYQQYLSDLGLMRDGTRRERQKTTWWNRPLTLVSLGLGRRAAFIGLDQGRIHLDSEPHGAADGGWRAWRIWQERDRVLLTVHPISFPEIGRIRAELFDSDLYDTVLTLQAAIQRRDVEKIIQLSTPDIQLNSGDPCCGHDLLRSSLRDEAFWKLLERAIGEGVSPFTLAAPSAWSWPAQELLGTLSGISGIGFFGWSHGTGDDGPGVSGGQARIGVMAPFGLGRAVGIALDEEAYSGRDIFGRAFRVSKDFSLNSAQPSGFRVGFKKLNGIWKITFALSGD